MKLRWLTIAGEPHPLKNIQSLPSYGFQFFFRNMGGFRSMFWGLTLCSVLSALLKFASVFLLSEVVNQVTHVELERLLEFYLPLYLLSVILGEIFDFFTRRYGEAFPTVYADQLTLRFYTTLLELRFDRLFNISKERLRFIIAKYVSNVSDFLRDWFWTTSHRLTQLAIVIGILGYQDPRVLLINSLYVLLFLGMAFYISSRFSRIAREFTETSADTSAITERFLLYLNAVKRLHILPFFQDVYRRETDKKWTAFDRVRSFHAYRWFFQLNIFNLLYVGTLFFGIYQVKLGTIEVGFLLLIKYAFDELWKILVYFIEYYVSLVQQYEDTALIQRELAEIYSGPPTQPITLPENWRQLQLAQFQLSFSKAGSTSKRYRLEIPSLTFKRGQRVGIVGESGSGKTSLLYSIMNLIPFSGTLTLDQEPLKEALSSKSFSYINAIDPLFNISVRENILLGRNIGDAELEKILAGVEILTFCSDLDQRVGDAGFHLSAGQEQRIRIARGLVKKAPLLLMDEPFTGIDAGTKQRIITFLKNFLCNTTVVLVTHNEDELHLIDQVYKLQQEGPLSYRLTT